MSAYDWSRPLATANRLIKRYGQPGRIARKVAGTGLPHNPEVVGPAYFDIDFVTLSYEDKEVDGSRVLMTDKKILVAVGNLPIVPTVSDTMVEKNGALLYRIMNVEPLEPGGVTLFYWIQGRR